MPQATPSRRTSSSGSPRTRPTATPARRQSPDPTVFSAGCGGAMAWQTRPPVASERPLRAQRHHDHRDAARARARARRRRPRHALDGMAEQRLQLLAVGLDEERARPERRPQQRPAGVDEAAHAHVAQRGNQPRVDVLVEAAGRAARQDGEGGPARQREEGVAHRAPPRPRPARARAPGSRLCAPAPPRGWPGRCACSRPRSRESPRRGATAPPRTKAPVRRVDDADQAGPLPQRGQRARDVQALAARRTRARRTPGSRCRCAAPRSPWPCPSRC